MPAPTLALFAQGLHLHGPTFAPIWRRLEPRAQASWALPCGRAPPSLRPLTLALVSPLLRSAVVFIEGSERVSVVGNVFERVDGNAVMLSAYNRNASISYNEFAWIGATAIAFWGNTEDSAGADSVMPEGYGSDGTSANQPRLNTVSFNLCRELGILEKQSSFYTQFKSAQNHIHSNIVRARMGQRSASACARMCVPRAPAAAHLAFALATARALARSPEGLQRPPRAPEQQRRLRGRAAHREQPRWSSGAHSPFNVHARASLTVRELSRSPSLRRCSTLAANREITGPLSASAALNAES